MVYCSKCGSENDNSASFCFNCGASLRGDAPAPAPAPRGGAAPSVTVMPSRHKSSGKGVAIALVIILAVAGTVYLGADHFGHKAEIAIYVHSTHLTETVDVQFIIDDEVIMTYEDLEPGHYCYTKYYQPYYFSAFDSSAVAVVKAISTGGGLGTQTDTEELIVQHGQKYEVHLYV